MTQAPPDPTQSNQPQTTQTPRKFWTGGKIAAAVIAVWLLLMLANAGEQSDQADPLAFEGYQGEQEPGGVVLDPGYAAADGGVEPAAPPAPEETGPSASDMIETELSNSVVY